MNCSYISYLLLVLFIISVSKADQVSTPADPIPGDGDLAAGDPTSGESDLTPGGPTSGDSDLTPGNSIQQNHFGSAELQIEKKCPPFRGYWDSWRWWFSTPQCGRKYYPVYAQCRIWQEANWSIVECKKCASGDGQQSNFPDAPAEFDKGSKRLLALLIPRCQIRYYCCPNI